MRGHESHDATISFESIVGSPNSEVHRALILAKSKYLRKVVFTLGLLSERSTFSSWNLTLMLNVY